MNIFTYLKKKGIDTIDASFYSKIAMWDSWYRSDVKKFHWYRIYSCLLYTSPSPRDS